MPGLVEETIKPTFQNRNQVHYQEESILRRHITILIVRPHHTSKAFKSSDASPFDIDIHYNKQF